MYTATSLPRAPRGAGDAHGTMRCRSVKLDGGDTSAGGNMCLRWTWQQAV